ncbi:TraG family conjugative transposon ATPase [Belliella kenyensis]|uniref:TraG family conjugative transposon ATPase n=1 Tax=Belliella kenyensis TaxID=1472724 RepID=A0ABV8EN93_9BACT|nr:TraG family conjugative transposon ATPase [Belliella kenyensis]MCH7400866.1 TraG family conjugative transposon ATPase [Belliella kenyensis]MDN3601847.1 TraG family conjugative transposon ATPase [Belliella kenyensis]
MISQKESREMEALFPIYAVAQDLIISKQADLTACFSLSLPEVFTLGQAQHDAIQEAFVKAIKLLPSGYIFHKQDWFTHFSYKASLAEQSNFLDNASELFFHERPGLKHRSLLMLTKRNPEAKLLDSSLSNLLRKNLIPKELAMPSAVEELETVIGQCCQLLEDAGIGIQRIGGEALTAEQSPIEAVLNLNQNKGSSMIADLQFYPDWNIAGKYPIMFSIADSQLLPNQIASSATHEAYSTDNSNFIVGYTAPIASLLPCSHCFNQYLFVQDRLEMMKQLEAKRLRLFSLSAYSRENALAADDIQAYLNHAIKAGSTPVKAHFNLICWTSDKSKVPQLRNLAAAALSKMDVLPKLESIGAPQLYWASMPGNEAAFPMNESFVTFAEPASCLLITETQYKAPAGRFGVRLGDRITGFPIQVDLSDEPIKKGWITNRNKFILGPSGSGKSFFTNHMIRSYYQQGAHVVLVDVGHSYKGLCDLVGGFYFTYQEDKPINFNPFFLAGQQLDTEKKESLKTLLLALWKKDDELFTRSEYVAISNALKSYYDYLAKQPSVFPCFDTFYEFLLEEFALQLANEKVHNKDFDLNNFLYVLKPYYKGGEFDYLLNAKENLDLLKQPFIVFELDNIKDHPILFPVVTLIIMEIFISKMRKLKGIRKIILIEEAWKAIAKEGMAEYIKYLFKTVRKFFGEAIVVTQEVDDIISSPVVKDAIINNSDCKILLDQAKYQNKFQQIQTLLGLTDKERMQILSINKANEPGKKYKEVFIGLGPVSKVYRTEVSLEEYLTYSTEESEKHKLDTLTAQYAGDREKAIQQMALDLRHEADKKQSHG